MEGPNAAGAGMFLLAMGEAPNFYSGFLPSLFTIATFTGDSEEKAEHTKRWIRRGEIQATGMTLIVGAATSLISGTPWPLLGMFLMAIYLVSQYEFALRKGQKDGLGMDIAGQ